MLPFFLQSVNWWNKDHRMEARRLLALWTKPSPLDALQLLDVTYADASVRDYAVKLLDTTPDTDLQLYLLQLVQCLKYEAHHESSLARLLINRAIASPYCLGHYLFWHIKAESHAPEFCER
jgi:hypothetical protein